MGEAQYLREGIVDEVGEGKGREEEKERREEALPRPPQCPKGEGEGAHTKYLIYQAESSRVITLQDW